MDYEMLAWVVRGKQRISIIKAMNKPMTPSQIRKKSIQYDPKEEEKEGSHLK